MSAQILARGFCLASTIGTVYYGISEPLQALTIPLIGYGLTKLGDRLRSNDVHKLGMSILCGHAIGIPGATIGSIVYALGKEVVPAKMIGYFVSFQITLLVKDILDRLMQEEEEVPVIIIVVERARFQN